MAEMNGDSVAKAFGLATIMKGHKVKPRKLAEHIAIIETYRERVACGHDIWSGEPLKKFVPVE